MTTSLIIDYYKIEIRRCRGSRIETLRPEEPSDVLPRPRHPHPALHLGDGVSPPLFAHMAQGGVHLVLIGAAGSGQASWHHDRYRGQPCLPRATEPYAQRIPLLPFAPSHSCYQHPRAIHPQLPSSSHSFPHCPPTPSVVDTNSCQQQRRQRQQQQLQ